jgi:hypothetical protein
LVFFFWQLMQLIPCPDVLVVATASQAASGLIVSRDFAVCSLSPELVLQGVTIARTLRESGTWRRR